MGDNLDYEFAKGASIWLTKYKWCTERFGPIGESGWQIRHNSQFVFDDPSNELMFKLVFG